MILPGKGVGRSESHAGTLFGTRRLPLATSALSGQGRRARRARQRVRHSRPIAEAVRASSIEQAKEFAAKVGGKTSIQTFVDRQSLWKVGGAMEMEVKEQTETSYVFNVTRCKYAEMYLDMGWARSGTCFRASATPRSETRGIAAAIPPRSASHSWWRRRTKDLFYCAPKSEHLCVASDRPIDLKADWQTRRSHSGKQG